jgi:four helix bundle protein
MNASSQNSTEGGNYRSFEDLEVYKVARDFRKLMYGLAKTLPDIEKFGLVGQIRRAAVSLTNNLAEGHGRFHFLDQIRFTLISRGSLEELMDDLNICFDEAYGSPAQIDNLKRKGWHLLKLTNGYLRYLRDRKIGSSLAIHESPTPYSTEDCNESMEWLEKLLEENPEIRPEPTTSPFI